MDSKDFEILTALYVNARQSYLSLGRRVSLSVPSVRDRLDRLKEQGILRGFVLHIDPGVFDRDEVILYFEGEWTADQAKRILSAPNVVRVALKIGGGMSVQTWPRNRQDSADDMESLLGKSPSWQVSKRRREQPLSSPLSKLDLEVIDALIDDPRLPINDLSRVTGLSPKTVRKHLGFMVESGVVSIRPKLGALVGPGGLIFQLLVFGEVAMEKLRLVMSDAILVTRMHEPPTKYLLCRGRDLAEVTSKTRAIEKLPGVDSVEITLNRELFLATDFIHSLVRQEILNVDQRLAHEGIRVSSQGKKKSFPSGS